MPLQTLFPPSLAGPLRPSTYIPKQYTFGGRDKTGYPKITLNDREANRREDFPSNAIYTTKYTVWSFIPKVLYEQFRKATSFYFLVIAFISSFPSVSPISPLTSYTGLFFILAVSAIKEAYEDYNRMKADLKMNALQFTRLDPATGTEKQLASYEIEVGDILICRQNSRIPADLLVLKSSNDDGTGFMETAQLDGETNLKLRLPASDFTARMTQSDLCQRMKGTLTADTPTPLLYSFKGSLQINGAPQDYSVDEKNLCLTGAMLRNTDWIIGLVVYAGCESKLGLNLKLPPSKFSTLDKKLNSYIVLIFVFKLCLVIAAALYNHFFEQSNAARFQFLFDPTESAALRGFKAFVTYFILLNYLIPLSLVVTLDIVRFLQAAFIEYDETFYHDSKEATATTSNLNDELALVDFVFSDKTGTLTENLMEFKKASINGNSYEDSRKQGDLRKQLIDRVIDDGTTKFFAGKYLKILGLAHSCQTDEVKGKIVYKSASPDEEALCDAARENGYVFLGRQARDIHMEIRGKKKSYQLLVEMEFTSGRRRMSVIVKTPRGKILLLTKGADVEMQKRIGTDKVNQARLDATNRDLAAYSTTGLRTLILGFKELSNDQYNEFYSAYNAASNLIKGREEEVERVCSQMERELVLIGATAIEDKLQDGVPKTIYNLRRAGIKVWVITGDKEETAVNIGFSTNLLSPEMAIVYLNADTPDGTLRLIQDAQAKYGDVEDPTRKPFAFIVNGSTLTFITENYSEEFVKIAQHCTSVVCNRVAPLQKADIVKMVQDHLDCVTLSIGDGGNDVSMIQQAHIGVGIKGREGSQAARAADFAVPKFRHLEKLLLVHGRYSLLRNTKVIYMSFYKNTMVFICNWYFAFLNGASGQVRPGETHNIPPSLVLSF